jgi:hypothetical protein
MSLHKLEPSMRAGKTPPRQPDYPDELTKSQLDAIRKMIDPDGRKTATRTVLHAPAW